MNQAEKTPEFAYRLAILIETGLLSIDQYQTWSDQRIAALDQPPLWLVDLSMEKQPNKAAGIIKQQAVIPYPEATASFNFKDFFAACYYVKVEQGTLSWQDFLLQAGICADGLEATIPVYDFYERLQQYVDSGQSETLKAEQMQWVKEELGEAIAAVKESYQQIIE